MCGDLIPHPATGRRSSVRWTAASRRSPAKTPDEIETLIVRLRIDNPRRGVRTLHPELVPAPVGVVEIPDQARRRRYRTVPRKVAEAASCRSTFAVFQCSRRCENVIRVRSFRPVQPPRRPDSRWVLRRIDNTLKRRERAGLHGSCAAVCGPSASRAPVGVPVVIAEKPTDMA